MNFEEQTFSGKNGSLNSLTSIDDCQLINGIASSHLQSTYCTSTQFRTITITNTLPATSIIFHTEALEPKSATTRPRKGSRIILSFICFEDIYERAEKFLDDEGLFVNSPNEGKDLKPPTTLKICLSPQRLASLNIQSDSTDDDGSPAQHDLAMPAFLAKRSFFHRSKSELVSQTLQFEGEGHEDSTDLLKVQEKISLGSWTNFPPKGS